MTDILTTKFKLGAMLAVTFFLISCFVFELGDGGCHTCSLDGENFEEVCDSAFNSDDEYDDAIQAMEDDGYTCEE